ncbi:hypothetical protein RJ639_044032 [Escallonia herrerae]|uniref:C2H2-type domain-containing protein n=1 Tax=Escallonia herrerae TaxID=1293975 RepID=A0AA88WG32_9ASTE|nr:hypothetical protein RJ639_044032 [Escallonia herrerae]
MAVEYQWHDHPLQLRSILSDSEPNASSASNPSQGTTTNAPKPTATSPSSSPASNYPSSPSTPSTHHTPSPSSSIHPTTPPATNARPPTPTLPTAAPPVPSFYTYTVPRNRGTSLTKSTTSLLHFQQIPQVGSCHLSATYVAMMASASTCNERAAHLCSLANEIHQHPLTLSRKRPYSTSCKACGNECTGTVFECEACDLVLDFKRALLPHTVRHRCHVDPLRLMLVGVGDDESDEFYCDACEQRRDPTHWVYYFKECEFSAHMNL